MTSDQKKVAIGSASGVITMCLLVFLLYYFLPAPTPLLTFHERFTYTFIANVFAIMPLFVMLIFVGNGRFLSRGIDPLQHAESHELEINGRVADNTLQQNFVFFVATMAITGTLRPEQMGIITSLTIVFMLARILFWIGYRIHPLYRAPGMGATAYLNLGLIVYTAYYAFTTFF
jgi:hypothetical protein